MVLNLNVLLAWNKDWREDEKVAFLSCTLADMQALMFQCTLCGASVGIFLLNVLTGLKDTCNILLLTNTTREKSFSNYCVLIPCSFVMKFCLYKEHFIDLTFPLCSIFFFLQFSCKKNNKTKQDFVSVPMLYYLACLSWGLSCSVSSVFWGWHIYFDCCQHPTIHCGNA